MEDKIELLKKLGFSDNYLKFVSKDTRKDESEISPTGLFEFDIITARTSEIIHPVIDKTEEPVNNYVN